MPVPLVLGRLDAPVLLDDVPPVGALARDGRQVVGRAFRQLAEDRILVPVVSDDPRLLDRGVVIVPLLPARVCHLRPELRHDWAEPRQGGFVLWHEDAAAVAEVNDRPPFGVEYALTIR